MSPLYGVMAAFASEKHFVAALAEARAAGYTRCEAFSPYPIEEANELALRRPSPVAPIMGITALVCAVSAYLLQYWATHDYPLDVGGRPLHSWPAFIPITFELTVLGTSIVGVITLLILARLPRLDHAVFRDPRFRAASRDRFFLCIRQDDPHFEVEACRKFLATHGAESVEEVPA